MPKTRGTPPPIAPPETMDDMRERAALDSYKAAYELSQRIQALGGAARVSLARRSPEGEWAHIRSFPASSFDIDRIADEFGGGHYRTQVYGTREDGSRGWLEGLGGVFDIEGEAKIIQRNAPVAAAAAVPAPASDAIKMATDMTQTIMAAVTAALAAVRPAQERDPIELLRVAKEMFQPAPQGIQPEKYITDRAESFDKGMEKGVEIGQREARRGGDDSWLGFAKDVVPEALRAINKAAPQLVAPAPVRPVLPMGAPPPMPAPPAQEVHTVDTAKPAWFVGLERWMPMVGFAAQNAMPPEDAAGLVIGRIPDALYDEFVDDVLGPDFVARVTPLLPPRLVATFPEWVSRTLDAIKVAVQEEQTQAEEPEPAGPGEPTP